MAASAPKKQWGGKRAGAGRPRSEKGPNKIYTFRLPDELGRIVEQQENRTEFIKGCIEQRLKGNCALEGAARPQAVQAVPREALPGQTLPGKAAQATGRRPGNAVPHREENIGKLGEIYAANAVEDVRLPFFDIGIAAGFPIPLDNDERAQNIELLRMLCPNPDASYLIRVKGDSMIDADIHSDDIVIVDKSNRNPSAHEVAVCEFNGEYTLKHFVMEDGVGWLVPDNPQYPKIQVTPDDEFSVWGTVTYIIHKPKA